MVMSDLAPGDLELVRLFVNTLDVESGADKLADPEALLDWLRERGLAPGGRASGADLHNARRLREAMRGLLLENNGVSVRKEAALTLGHGCSREPARGDPSPAAPSVQPVLSSRARARRTPRAASLRSKRPVCVFCLHN